MDSEVIPVPLLEPAGGVPRIVDTETAFEAAIEQMRQGTGAFAVDAERASGFRYSARAYLIQIKRTNGGLHLIDPIPFGPGHRLMNSLNDLLNTDEVILHASTQDLPCLRELGINPSRLFDTELAGRILGLPRVGLGPLLESLMAISLAKEHSAADWSTRPLPIEWLNYAALDVELMIELREIINSKLIEVNKSEWAHQEFAAILLAPPAPARVDPWRRTSGMHKIKRRDQLAIIRELWQARDEIARAADIAGGKLLNDYAIVELALNPPTTKREFEKTLRPLGLRNKWIENINIWLSATARAVALPEDSWPSMRTNSDTLPPIKLWRDKFPEKFAPLSHARHRIEIIASENSIPAENLISPEVVRRICWAPPSNATKIYSPDAVRDQLISLGARTWQIDLVSDAIANSLLENEPLEVVESVPETTPEEA